MLEELIRRHFGPLIAVLASDAVENSTAKSGLTFAELLTPFLTIQCNIQDPSGASVSTRLVLDVRDLRRDGFLLTLTVLPSVLHEAVSAVASTSDTEIATAAFTDSLLEWTEPAEHELLRTYVACVFAVSTEDGDPVGELARLVHLQHTQQHGGATLQSIGPAQCVPPKWLLPNVLKYYVLVDDVSLADEARANEVFSSMCTIYGDQNCHLLRINSGSAADLPDPWQSCLEVKYRGLESGLELARRNLLSKSAAYADITNTTVSTVEANVALPAKQEGVINNNDFRHPKTPRYMGCGRCVDAADRERIARLINELTYNALIPFIERQMRTLNEQIAARRGISKSLTTGVRKWFGAATQPPSASSLVTYSQESNEMQTRRLADMCFVFGLYSFAHQLYQNMKKEFALDQAWLYYAGALEMAAITLYLNNPQIGAKHYPQHYMENALNYYTNTCMRPILAVRAALLSTIILGALELNVEAATQLLRLANLDNDLFSGVLQERASVMFAKAGMHRKMAFHYILAGHRFYKAGQSALSIECYKRALPQYANKHWQYAEDHILYKLANECGEPKEALEWCSRLIRSQSSQNADQQMQFLKLYVALLQVNASTSKTPPVVRIPVVNSQQIRVIYGERPVEPCAMLNSNESTKVSAHVVKWKDLERAAFNAVVDPSVAFKPTPLVSDASTDNSKIRSTPPFERLRIQIDIRNPLDIPLTLRHLQLGIKGDPSHVELSVVDEMVIEPASEWNTLELYVIPGEGCTELHVSSLVFELTVDETSVTCQIPLSVRGPRLNTTKKQVTSVVYGTDHRLDACVSTKRWPLLDIEMLRTRHVNAFCGQIYRIECDVVNIGSVPVQSFCMVTDRVELVTVAEEFTLGEDSVLSEWRTTTCFISSTNQNILVFKFRADEFAIGERRRLRIALRAPANEVSGYGISLIFYYRGGNGMVREQRHLISMDTRPLLATSIRLVDASIGMCVLRAHNLISTRNSVLAKVELLRIRSIVNGKAIVSDAGGISDDLTAWPTIYLRPVRNRNVQLECDQHDSYCFTACGNAFSSCSNVLWISDPIADLPEWPILPLFFSSDTAYLPRVIVSNPAEKEQQLSLSFGVLWKASVVNTDGTIANVFGENFVENPYPLGYSIPGCIEFTFMPSTSDQPITTPGTFSMDDLNLNEMLGESRALVCTVTAHPPIISHDFSVRRFCAIPIRVSIINCDRRRRNCDLVLRFVASTESAHSRLESTRAHETSASMTSLPLMQSTAVSNNAVRQSLMVADRAVSRAVLPFGQKHVFNIRVSVACASVYEVDCFEVSARFEGDENELSLALPTAYATVIDTRLN
uniref:Trafficking protein particle complex subunit 8 n=1 Tax=Ascaris suum TaxID=6253 RepID=F1KRT5_ASCSU